MSEGKLSGEGEQLQKKKMAGNREKLQKLLRVAQNAQIVENWDVKPPQKKTSGNYSKGDHLIQTHT